MNLKTKTTKVKYYLNKQGEFVIDNYNNAKPFANFFPGIAGKYGIPMWVFYVNRGQCICSFGTRDKDQAILEFFPANKAWQFVSNQGFRTFIKIKSKKENTYYEPFHNGYSNLKYHSVSSMRISSSALFLEEENYSLGIKTKIEYFNIPNDTYAGLSRTVTIENTSNKLKNIQLIDGLPQIVPFGTNNFFLKKLSRTIEAWMNIDNLNNNIPFYKLQVDPTDRPEVVHIDEGNFYLSFHFNGTSAKLIRPIVDPGVVFGAVTDFSYPALFLAKSNFTYPAKQITKSKTPSALLLLNLKLAPGTRETFYSVIGQARDCKTLNQSVKKITKFGYIQIKSTQNNALITKLKNDIATTSSSKALDLYTGQTYLDNIMRGGYPEVFSRPSLKPTGGGTPPEEGKDESAKTVFYLYSRKHGDLERDYNKFSLQPTYLSQGNGNYRDMNQNRRNDVWFNPEIKDENVIFFINLIQSDGFNPLVIKGESFLLDNRLDLTKLLGSILKEDDIHKLRPFLKKHFTPGDLIFFIEENKITVNGSYDELLDLILGSCVKSQEADHAEGFWTDHWTYNLDLIERYLSLYPEKFHELFFDKKVFTFYDNVELVRPRSEKYVLYKGKPRQLHSLTADAAKKELLHKRSNNPHLLRTLYGSGEIYYTTLIAKLLCLAVNKLSSLDPFGVGIEMEANKPNWFDSLNGLPALFGSSSCETFELKRLLRMIKLALENSQTNEIEITQEVANFIKQLANLLTQDAFSYWDSSNNAKEEYRYATRLGFSGNLINIPTAELYSFLNAALKKVETGLNKAFNSVQGTYDTYFINEVTQYDLVKDHYIRPTKFTQIPAPLFLEGQMHGLRLSESSNQAIGLYQATKKSELFDKKLKMYKVSASLRSMPEEIGRCRVFTPGWLENESIWLHMEYKYILELLKTGLIKEFYAEFKNVLIPFQNPQRYGRSILENSSFLASSAFLDQNLVGNGFVARLSGSTAEFLHIWLVMNVGNRPFGLDGNGRLRLEFKPNLAGWLFTKNGKYSFNFLSRIPVTYYNSKRKNTFGKNSVKIVKIVILEDNCPTEINSATIPSALAEKVRSRQVSKIDIYLE